MKTIVEECEYNGRPLMIIRQGEDKFPFQFGVKKARLILENIDKIKAFAEKYKTLKCLTVLLALTIIEAPRIPAPPCVNVMCVEVR